MHPGNIKSCVQFSLVKIQMISLTWGLFFKTTVLRSNGKKRFSQNNRIFCEKEIMYFSQFNSQCLFSEKLRKYMEQKEIMLYWIALGAKQDCQIVIHPGSRHPLKAAQGEATTGPAVGRFPAKEESCTFQNMILKLQPRMQQSVSLQDLFVGQWWSGNYRKEPGKLVGATFRTCRTYHSSCSLWIMYITGEKIQIIEVTKQSFSLSFSCPFLKDTSKQGVPQQGRTGKSKNQTRPTKSVNTTSTCGAWALPLSSGMPELLPSLVHKSLEETLKAEPGLTSLPHLWPCGNPAS